jgi:hypothetical protein
MARDRASINTNLWVDQDWRNLPTAEQHLYMMLLSHPTLSYAGVADWRTARLAAMTGDATPESVAAAAEGLQAERFVFIDNETEEILIRSFLRHDGLLKQPKLSISMVNAFGAIASSRIREVVTHELQKLYTEYPTWAAFGQEKVLALTKGKGTDMAAFTHSFTLGLTPTVTPAFTLKLAQADPLPTTTTTTTTTNTLSRRSPETRIPDDWKPNSSHEEKAAEKHLDVNLTAEAFRNHAEANDRRARNWDAAFRNWILKATPGVPAASRNITSQYAWANK